LIVNDGVEGWVEAENGNGGVS